MLIRCPWCGERDQSEFTYGGDAAAMRPADPDAISREAWVDHIYLRANPKGPHAELWQHSAGCRAWIKVVRDTTTHEVLATGGPHDALAPDATGETA
ncbi:N-methylglutamate dehydrogenase subunit B [Limimonas halophila]|uniref:N-methylglutamate dehydrogenase subunit B n=1 Tax=Limimonas halophila TaxID=1082479 RepID=A0A1G7L3J5_9PROT|nr:sarcosine oxidase subunit delta [Limimonas halophila]SDF43894.1 N-methylglutamate dehydrogenase subunit B [Limimonas halophila]